MPGITGLVAREADGRIASIFQRIVAPMRRDGLQSEELVSPLDRWALGRCHLGILQPAPQLSSPSPITVLFHGELDNTQDLLRSLGGGQTIPTDSPEPALIRDLYVRHGPSMASHLKGTFSAAILDEPGARLILISDLLGSYPLYWYKGPERFVFASELKSVLRDPGAPRALDRRAVADYVKLGFVTGTRTLAEGVEMLPPGSVLTYCWRDGTSELRTYRSVDGLFTPARENRAERLDILRQTFVRAVLRAQSNGHPVGLSLSGGLDTRAILSATDASRPISTYTLGVKGCADDVIARKLATLSRTRHQFFELDDRYLSEFLANLRRMVSLTDGMYLSHGLTEILALNFLRDADFRILLRGHCGELAKSSLAWPFHVDPRVRELQNTEALIEYLLGRIDPVGAAPVADLFHEDWREVMAHGARESLRQSAGSVMLPMPDLCSYLYVYELHRRFTAPSLEIFRNQLEVRLPFADEDFLTELLRTPAEWRYGTEIHRHIIRPELLRVRNSNTGAPGNAGPLQEQVLDKLNSLFKRLDIHGFRHYHHFDAWLKRQLLDSVEAVLLDHRTLDRGILKASVLRRLIDDTRSGAVESGYLFQVLLNVEIWHRENLD